MKILLVSERTELKGYIRRNFMPRGAEIVQYLNPIKAMDNLDEVEPDVVLFSAEDFPRHWKPFLVFLRNTLAREQCVFVLLTGDEFDLNEADKAQALQVNGIIHERLTDRQELVRLKDLVNRYRDIGDPRSEKRLVPTPIDRVGFVFTHPETLHLIHGLVEDVSAAGVSFIPADRQETRDLPADVEVPCCSLRVGEYLVPVSARIVRNDRSITLVFDRLTDGQRAVIRTYVTGHAQRELERMTADHPTEVEPV